MTSTQGFTVALLIAAAFLAVAAFVLGDLPQQSTCAATYEYCAVEVAR